MSAFKRGYDALAEEGEPYRVTTKFDPERGCHVASLKLERELEPATNRLSTIIGDVAHNTRSALDFVAWRLALKNAPHSGKDLSDPRVARKVSFPIATSCKAFRDHAAFTFFSEDALALIEEFQPYNRSPYPKRDALYILREISNQDKHRVFPVELTALDISGVTFRPRSIYVEALQDVKVTPLLRHGDTFDDGTEIALIHFSGDPEPPATNVEVKGQPSARILFSEWGIGPDALAGIATGESRKGHAAFLLTRSSTP